MLDGGDILLCPKLFQHTPERVTSTPRVTGGRTQDPLVALHTGHCEAPQGCCRTEQLEAASGPVVSGGGKAKDAATVTESPASWTTTA